MRAPCNDVRRPPDATCLVHAVPGRCERCDEAAQFAAVPWCRCHEGSLKATAVATTDGPAKCAGVTSASPAGEILRDTVFREEDSNVCGAQRGEREDKLTIHVSTAGALLPHARSVCL